MVKPPADAVAQGLARERLHGEPLPVAGQRSTHVHALAKGLQILSAFSEGDFLSNQDLVAMTGMPKATVSRLTSTLVDLGYLRADARSRKLVMGSRVVVMGVSVQRKLVLQRLARPHMEALSQEYGLTVSLGTRDRLAVVFLEVCRPPNHAKLVVNFDAGTHMPLARTAIGMACIVTAPVKERSRILEQLRSRSDEPWEGVRARIETAHSEYQRWGFITMQSLISKEVSGVAVPIAPPDSNTAFAFNFAGPSSSMPIRFMREELGPRLQRMAREILQTLARTRRPKVQVPPQHR